MAVDTYALTTLIKLKRYLGEPGSQNDSILEECINRASDRVEQFCDREFVSRDRLDWVFMDEDRKVLVLDQFPVTAVRRMSYGSRLCVTVNATTSTDVRATVSVSDSAVILKRWDSSGTAATSTLDFATYPTTNSLATAVNLLTGWSCSASENRLTEELYPVAGIDALNTTAYLYWPDITDSEYDWDAETGVLHVSSVGLGSEWSDGNRPFLVDYTAGYSTVPDDVEQACLEVAADIYRVRRYDTGNVTGDFRTIEDPAQMQQILQARLANRKRVR